MMQIRNNSERSAANAKQTDGMVKGTKSPLSMKKAECLADIFNNDCIDEKRPIKLRLSRGAKVITEDFRKAVKELCAVEKKLALLIDQIELPEGAEINGDTMARKMMVYIRWLSADGDRAEEPICESIQKIGADDSIIELYNIYKEKQQMVMQQRKQNAPSYYYQCYPEAYSFN